MSTLTKILIVLLTISSFFLCGVVVIYVATANNYREQNITLKSKLRAAQENEKKAKKQLSETIANTDRTASKLRNEIASVKTKLATIGDELKSAEREKALLIQKVDSFASIMKGLGQTNDKYALLFENTLNELNKVQAQQVKERKELNDTTTKLIEKMAIIETLETEKRQLLEEKIQLRAQLDRLLQRTGQATEVTRPVTLDRGSARKAAGVKDISLRAVVTDVELQDFLATISIGSAAGVKEGMRFHVTRGSEFICDILITDVETDAAVGVLDIIQKDPKVGDTAVTNF